MNFGSTSLLLKWVCLKIKGRTILKWFLFGCLGTRPNRYQLPTKHGHNQNLVAEGRFKGCPFFGRFEETTAKKIPNTGTRCFKLASLTDQGVSLNITVTNSQVGMCQYSGTLKMVCGLIFSLKKDIPPMGRKFGFS